MRTYHRIPLIERIAQSIEPDPVSGCWLWTKGLTIGGYGKIKVNGKTKLAHRVSYEVHVATIPEGFEIDHMCHDSAHCDYTPCPHRRCCNPAHLKAVTRLENIRRSDATARAVEAAQSKKASAATCKAGHPFTGQRYGGKRRCTICFAAYQKQWAATHPR